MLLILFFLLLLTSPIYGDGFDMIGNCSFNRYRQTTAISLFFLPESVSNGNFGISYDTNLVEGTKTEDVWENISLGTLTENDYWRRIPGVLDNVSGPPGTEIDILYFFLNQTGHTVEVSKIALPFSRTNLDQGNWLKLASMYGNSPIYREIPIPWEQLVLGRKSLTKEYSGPGLLYDGQGGSEVVDSLTISDPILIKDIQVVRQQDGVKITLWLENITTEPLEDILLEHFKYVKEVTIPALEEIEVSYLLKDFSGSEVLRITNPNSAQECIIYGNSFSDWTKTEAITVLAYREDGGWVNGSYVQPEVESFCIRQIPYTTNIILRGYEDMWDETAVSQKEEKETAEGEATEEESSVKEDKEEILGISREALDDQGVRIKRDNFLLPKTGVVIY